MQLGSEHGEGQKSVPKKSQIPTAEALSDWQSRPPSHPSSTTFPNSPLLLPLPPHLLLIPLWPASVVCLGWLIIRDTKILLSPPPFLSAEMSHFLARASVAGPLPGDTLLFIAPFPPQKKGAWEGVFRGVYTHTLKLSACIHTNTNPPTLPHKDTHTEKSQACSGTHTSWPGFKHPTGPRTHSPRIPRLMFVFLPRAASLPAFKVSVFRDVPPGAAEIYIPFPAFFRRKRPRFFWPHMRRTNTVLWGGTQTVSHDKTRYD